MCFLKKDLLVQAKCSKYLCFQINKDKNEMYRMNFKLSKKEIAALRKNLKLNLANEDAYLSHLASFDISDKQILVSNWAPDYTTFTKFKTDELGNQVPDGDINKSIVLKLYEPLPTNINKNDKLWISKLMSLPIIQNVILTGTSDDNCKPLRAPNFGIDVDFNFIVVGSGQDQYVSNFIKKSAMSIIFLYLLYSFCKF